MSTTDKLSNGNAVTKRSVDHKRSSIVSHHDSISYQDNRGHWGSRMEFLLACLGYSVGLGNLWRFPYLAYENGGAAFLLPYVVLLTAVGRPLYLTEVALGQYSQLGPIHTYKKIAPLMAGFGITQILSTIMAAGSYMVMLSYSVHYLFTSISYIGHVLPWSRCDLAWADENCYVMGEAVPCGANNQLVNGTPCVTSDHSSAMQYWKNEVLRIDSEGLVNFGEMGEIMPSLVMCVFVCWVIACLCLIKGIKSSGKAVYFTATFPFLVLLVLMIAGVQLEGASQGLKYLFLPDWNKLLDIEVWRKALEQVIFSLSVGGGGLVTFGSYNDFNNKVHIDVMILSVLDLVASLMCAVTIFSVLGAMAYELGIEDVSTVMSSGPGLAFVAYPEAISRTLPVPHLWSFLFFFMVFTLGLDSMFGGLENLLTAIFDQWPITRRHKPIVVTLVCIAFFCFGLPFCTPKGQYVFYLIDVFSFGIGSLLGGILTSAAVHWVFGVTNFSDMMEFMLNYRPSIIMQTAWAVVAPVTLLVVFIGSLFNWKWPLYAGKVEYPMWAIWLGAMFPLIKLAPVSIGALMHVFKMIASGRGRDILKPDPRFGPGCPVARQRLSEVQRLNKEAKKSNKRLQKGSVNIAFESTDL